VCVESASASNNQLRALLEEEETMDALRVLAGSNKPIEVRCVAADTLALLTNNKERIAELEAEYGLNFSYGQVEISENDKADPNDLP